MTDRSGKATSDDPAPSGRFVFVEDANGTPRQRKSLPNPSPDDISVLRTLLEEACSAPDDWYRLPGTPLALRMIPTGGADHALRFEIRADQSPGEIRRYHYDSRRRVLACRKNYAIEYYESPPPKHELGKEDTQGTDGTDSFALSIAALVGQWPASTHLSGSLMRVEAHNAETIRSGLRESSPVQSALSDLIRRLTNRWFGLTTHFIGRNKRLLYAFAGSVSFFSARIFTGVSPDKFSPFLLSDFGLQFTIILGYTIIIFPSFLFAWIVSWENQKYSPIRLYLSGFLLPYFVTLLGAKIPDF